MAEPGRYDKGSGRTEAPGLVDDRGNLAGGRGDHDQLGNNGNLSSLFTAAMPPISA
ncbi:hypothetical protein SAMN05216525_14348 [Bradyrhizobium sp. Gha]|nr:hypothetical protein SAMN05216525_14348 [Bradyrhizobium sp. Gha]